jgi:predicted transcriptional regulator
MSDNGEDVTKNNTIKPTDSELEILNVLWEHGPSTVKFVNEKMNEKKETGYTTTLKLMQIMADKGILKRERESRSHIYSVVYKKSETQNSMINRLAKSMFGGSPVQLAMHALGNAKASSEELEEIKKLLGKIEKK